jgi:hypothetical protein
LAIQNREVMTKQELELMDSFGKLEIAIKSMAAEQAIAMSNWTSVNVTFFQRDIEELQTILQETKDKFYKIMTDHSED